MGRQAAVVLYVLAMIAVVVGVDIPRQPFQPVPDDAA
jgi:hypothetical protein